MYWAALVPLSSTASESQIDQQSLGIWALQFSPRVALVEASVLVEVEASARLFHGMDMLRERIEQGACELGARVAWAPTGLAALALAKHGVSDGFSMPLQQVLDRLPLDTITAVARHQPTLARVGCRTLGQVRALPRGGIGRRFDKSLLSALDEAYGLRPESYDWLTLPESFHARLELMSRVETGPALLFGARRLLLQMVGWLRARRLGTTAFTVRWCYDVMRGKSTNPSGELTVRTATATQDVEHLVRLLAEHLAKVELEAPAGELELRVAEAEPLVEESRSLIPDTIRKGASIALTLERIQARLGEDCVRRPILREDHRPERIQTWVHSAGRTRATSAAGAHLPLPSWILDEPLQLLERDNRPVYQGTLQLLLGPDRIEGGWWHRVNAQGEEVALNVQRDYWLALSPCAGVLCVFQARLAGDKTAWYLHGHYG
ncbi:MULTISPECIES: Y-family DNA polymerase [Delftia]|jgi:protein ImuB|uniref:Y-family DNA polymerase n=1 Tax=Delftia TaxID=80865 RepID=UPI000B493579|nr:MULTISPECIES: DNA polymerase Y family protein [Delftia]MDH2234363.1 DNA polymerase Y family protein [Delftia tsuruhatensis]OWG12429.1 DNA polymerase [Delftia sp. K82]